MSRVIYKYTADANGHYHIPFPLAMPVFVAQQFEDQVFPTLWAEVETELKDAAPSGFDTYGTGHPIPEGSIYAGSAVCGDYVWHVYGPGQ